MHLLRKFYRRLRKAPQIIAVCAGFQYMSHLKNHLQMCSSTKCVSDRVKYDTKLVLRESRFKTYTEKVDSIHS